MKSISGKKLAIIAAILLITAGIVFAVGSGHFSNGGRNHNSSGHNSSYYSNGGSNHNRNGHY